MLALRRLTASAGSAALSAVIFVLVPKCPMCVAGYVAAWSGVGISLAAAAVIRDSLLWVGAGILVLAAVGLLRGIRHFVQSGSVAASRDISGTMGGASASQ